ncbi:MAG: 1,4-alpha-glucan branching protein GlgB [Lachnospiraceae bacterium]|nr:1,4-alpha-glucan branching protein GlgB [Lachnospiraceae bacterium]
MQDQLYDLMDWAKIEGIVYSEEDHPKEILGPHITEEGILIQCFFPGETQVALKTSADNKLHPMTQQDEAGYFAILLKGEKIPDYVFVVGDEKHERKVKDAYAFGSVITEKEETQFAAGICYHIYEKLGAHPMKIDGTQGTFFAVWAPNALRVSVVGAFNSWDGRRYPMERRKQSGIFELFIPDLKEGETYQYEIKLKSGVTYKKADPYANAAQLRSGTASVIADLSHKWQDQVWMAKRKQYQAYNQPMFIYEVQLGSWMVPENREETYFCNYRKLAHKLSDYVKDLGYTHVELLGIMEHPLDDSWGGQISGYYAPTARYGTPQDFLYFMDYMHQQGIGVILSWVPSYFAPDDFSFGNFDGTCLYEHKDPRKGVHPSLGALMFNYGRPQVSNFLIANALFWAEKFHADGLRMGDLDAMLYLDYGREDGAWVANMYGSNENLEAVECIKHLNSIFKKRYPDALLIAEETAAWPRVTGALEEEGLGFDYKWNDGWKNDFLGYMKLDPLFRGAHHEELTFSMVYAYSERFILALPHREMTYGKGSMLDKMPGGEEQRFSNLRLAYAYMMVHPGKKLLFMGQDQGVAGDWDQSRGLTPAEESMEMHLKTYMQELLKVYRQYPALSQKDLVPEGFVWINELEWEKNLLVFLRKGRKKEDTLLVVCNFSGNALENYMVGVPYPGKYKEIFNTDQTIFGGSGCVNSRVKMSKAVECDERRNSITLKLGALSAAVFTYTEAVEKLVDNKTAKSKTGRKRTGKRSLLSELKEKVSKEEHKA